MPDKSARKASGKEFCVAVFVLILSILQIFNLPVSVSGIIAALVVLCGCSGASAGDCCNKAAFITCAVFSGISIIVSSAVGISWLTGGACPAVQDWWNLVNCESGSGDAHCDPFYSTSPDYSPTYYLDYNCDAWEMPSTSVAVWSQADLMCYTCYYCEC